MLSNNTTTVQLTDGIGRTFAHARLSPMGQVLRLGITDASAMFSTSLMLSPESARQLAQALMAAANTPADTNTTQADTEGAAA